MHCPICGRKAEKTRKDYKYTESGLDDIVLRGLTVFVCDCGEEMPLIPHVGGLHDAIALEIVKKKALLTGTEVRFLRKELGLKSGEFAEQLGVHNVTVSRWETGEEPIGQANDKLIRLLLIKKLEHERNELIPLDVSGIYQAEALAKPINISMGNIAGHEIAMSPFVYFKGTERYHYNLTQDTKIHLDGLEYEYAAAA